MEPREFNGYQFYPDGRIWSAITNQWLNPTKHPKGYLVTTIGSRKGNRRTAYVHRFIAEAFIPNPLNLPQINHINGQKDDNRVENLEWCDRSHNIKHAYRTGLLKPVKGEKNGASKLTPEQVWEIKYVHTNLGQRTLAKMYGCAKTNIAKIRSGEAWKHI